VCDNASVCSGIKQREREEERHKQLYRFLPQTESSLVPLALPRRVHYNLISDYNGSLLKLTRDFKCSSTQARDFYCSNTQARDFYCSSTQARDFDCSTITARDF
jgi:hypothetical protein